MKDLSQMCQSRLLGRPKEWPVNLGRIERTSSAGCCGHRSTTGSGARPFTALHLLSDEMLAVKSPGYRGEQIPDVVDDLISSGLTAASVREVLTIRGDLG